ncbi:MAG TPA: hypothetical protein VI792_06040, partial [Candidatus Eisenbacteria bacterium]
MPLQQPQARGAGREQPRAPLGGRGLGQGALDVALDVVEPPGLDRRQRQIAPPGRPRAPGGIQREGALEVRDGGRVAPARDQRARRPLVPRRRPRGGV